MITLKQLLPIAPLGEDVRQQALQQLDALSPEQVQSLEMLCWDAICQEYNSKIGLIREKAMTESALGTKPFSVEEVKQQEEALFIELAGRLDSSATEEELEEVRLRLAKEKASTAH